MNSVSKNYKERITKVIGMFVFFSLLFGLFSNITYLFRNAGYDRNHVVGIKSEKENIDVVYIGGSAAFVYFEPLRAFNDCGFTSYMLATNSIGVENILPYIKYALKYHKPQLFVIGIRAFQYYSDDQYDQGLRYASDSMDILSAPRYEMIREYLENRNLQQDTDKVSYYLDIAKYHTNYENLANPNAWGFIDNTGTSQFKGNEITGLPALWSYIDTPHDFKTNERKDLLPNAQKEMNKLLSYCDENGIKLLFVVCPYAISKEHYEIYNTIMDQVTSHGYDFINTNDYYDEMGIDFATDFYEDNHVNIFGAQKYTEFLEKYISETYKLSDHRLDQAYEDWNKSVDEFFDTDKQVKEMTKQIILESSAAKR